MAMFAGLNLKAQTPENNESNLEHIFDSIKNTTNWDNPDSVEKSMDALKEKLQANAPNDIMQQQFDGIIGEEGSIRVQEKMQRIIDDENDTMNPDFNFIQYLSLLVINLDNPDSRFPLNDLSKYNNLQTLMVRDNASAVKVDMNELINQLQNVPIYYLYITNDKTGVDIIPESIGNLSNLSILGLFGNNISKLPESIGNLTLLKELYIDANPITSLPGSISKLKNLKILGIAKTNISVSDRNKIQALLPNCKILLQ